MISLGNQRKQPIGLQISPGMATLMQLGGAHGQLSVQAMARVPLPREEGLPAAAQDRAVAAALKDAVADHGFKGRDVVSCIGSDELFVQNVRLPQLPPEEVEKVVRWEAEERLPYPVEEAEIRHLLAAQVRHDANVKQEVILLACRQDVIARHTAMLEQAGLMPMAVDAEPCAVVRSFYSGERNKENNTPHAYFNIGRTATTVIFTEGDQILFLKYIAVGGDELDRAVAENLGIDLVDACRMRATVTAADELDPQNDVHRSVIESIRPHLENIASEIELCLRYYKVTFRGKVLQQLFLSGDEASPWLAHYLGDRLQAECSIGNPLEYITDARSDNARPCVWSTALGLALKGTA